MDRLFGRQFSNLHENLAYSLTQQFYFQKKIKGDPQSIYLEMYVQSSRLEAIQKYHQYLVIKG